MWTRSLAVSVIGLLAACSSTNTRLVNTWTDPSAGQLRFDSVLAVCACRNEGIRRTVEDQLAASIPGARQSYVVLPGDRIGNANVTKEAMKAGGFDAAVVMNLVSVEKSSTYVPGTPYLVPPGYRRMWWGWGFGPGIYGAYYDPGRIVEDQLVNFDTNVYSVADEKLVWASRSQTEDPKSVPQLVNDIIKATVAQMRQQGVIR